MRVITRHLSPLIRSRRRFPFILIISILLCTAFFFYNINYNHEANDINQDSKADTQHRILDTLINRTTAIVQK